MRAIAGLLMLATLATMPSGCTLIGATAFSASASSRNAKRTEARERGDREVDDDENVAASAAVGGLLGFVIDTAIAGVVIAHALDEYKSSSSY